MRTHISQYHGRGAARIRMPRPRIQSEAWNQNWRVDFANWKTLVKQIPRLLIQTRFFVLLAFVLVIVVLNYWISKHYHHEIQESKKITKKIIEKQQRLRLVLQYPALPKEQPAKPKPVFIEQEIPKPAPAKPAPVPKKKPKPRQVAKKSKPVKPKPKTQTALNSKPKVLRKKTIDLEAGLTGYKQFDRPSEARNNHRLRPKKEVWQEKDDLMLADSGKRIDLNQPLATSQVRKRHMAKSFDDTSSMEIEVTDKSMAKTGYQPTQTKQIIRRTSVETQLDDQETDLEIGIDTGKSQDFEFSSDQTPQSPAIANRQSGLGSENTKNEKIVVAVKDKQDYSHSESQSSTATPLTLEKKETLDHTPLELEKKTSLDHTPTKARSEVEFAGNGIMLTQLKSCGAIEKAIKLKLAELVRQKGEIKKCADKSGKYEFYWPAERFAVQHFNVIIYTSQGRIATDRCEELTNACKCLENN